MRKSKLLLINCFALLATMFMVSCSDDDEQLPAAPTVSLSQNELSGKSGEEIQATVTVTAPGGVKNLRITKQVNLQRDNTYGTNGVMTLTPTTAGATTYSHNFTYTLQPDEVDKLVSFNFMAEDVNAKSSQADLTVNTTASGELIISSYRWKFKSKQNVTGAQPVDDLAECLKDDHFTYNADGTMSIDYGTNACQFDGLSQYTGWTLSEDEKTFTQTYVNVFNTSQITTEVYNVTKLTKDEMVLEIFFDLSVFGLSDNEKYVYTMQAVAK